MSTAGGSSARDLANESVQVGDLREHRILATCTLGLGFSYRGFQAGLEQRPHVIACDGGTGTRLDIIGELGGGGNFAYPFSPSLIKVGPVYEWGAWHVMVVNAKELTELFPVTIEQI